jgi:hypothetical protein
MNLFFRLVQFSRFQNMDQNSPQQRELMKSIGEDVTNLHPFKMVFW